MPGCEDERLLAQVRSGNLHAFEELYRKYKNLVYRAALTITRDADAAEDVLQDAFLRLHAHADTLDGSHSIGPWLYRVTANLCYNWLNRRRRWQLTSDDKLDLLHAPRRTSPEATCERRELRSVVEEALGSLSANHRMVIALYYLGNFNLEEIAYILDCPVGTVKSRLHYARIRLREVLQEEDSVQTLWEAVRGVAG